MEASYSRIIEALNVRFLKARNIKLLKAVTVKNYYDVENTIIFLHKGILRYKDPAGGEPEQEIKPGQMLFIPASRKVHISYGASMKKAPVVELDNFVNNVDSYYEINVSYPPRYLEEDNYTYLTFETRFFDSLSFFSSLDLPAFSIPDSEAITRLLTESITEIITRTPGYEKVVRLNTELLVIEVVRYLVTHQRFLEKLATKTNYFKDPRLVQIFEYVRANLKNDLSNKELARIAGVSEDYVGQYFKMLTGINPQDYIEYQRMEAAVDLLRTTRMSIADIGEKVGFRGTAYFCRRFKMMFGIPAAKMRKREIAAKLGLNPHMPTDGMSFDLPIPTSLAD